MASNLNTDDLTEIYKVVDRAISSNLGPVLGRVDRAEDDIRDMRRDYYGVDSKNGRRSQIGKNTEFRESAQWHIRKLWTSFLGLVVAGVTWALWR